MLNAAHLSIVLLAIQLSQATDQLELAYFTVSGLSNFDTAMFDASSQSLVLAFPDNETNTLRFYQPNERHASFASSGTLLAVERGDGTICTVSQSTSRNSLRLDTYIWSGETASWTLAYQANFSTFTNEVFAIADPYYKGLCELYYTDTMTRSIARLASDNGHLLALNPSALPRQPLLAAAKLASGKSGTPGETGLILGDSNGHTFIAGQLTHSFNTTYVPGTVIVAYNVMCWVTPVQSNLGQPVCADAERVWQFPTYPMPVSLHGVSVSSSPTAPNVVAVQFSVGGGSQVAYWRLFPGQEPEFAEESSVYNPDYILRLFVENYLVASTLSENVKEGRKVRWEKNVNSRSSHSKHWDPPADTAHVIGVTGGDSVLASVVNLAGEVTLYQLNDTTSSQGLTVTAEVALPVALRLTKKQGMFAPALGFVFTFVEDTRNNAQILLLKSPLGKKFGSTVVLEPKWSPVEIALFAESCFTALILLVLAELTLRPLRRFAGRCCSPVAQGCIVALFTCLERGKETAPLMAESPSPSDPETPNSEDSLS